MRTVYILQSQSDPERYYVGQTTALDIRILEHQTSLSGYTSEHGPWQLTVAIQFRDATRAFLFERYLKTGSGRAFAKRHL